MKLDYTLDFCVRFDGNFTFGCFKQCCLLIHGETLQIPHEANLFVCIPFMLLLSAVVIERPLNRVRYP